MEKQFIGAWVYFVLWDFR